MLNKINKFLAEQDIRGAIACLRELVNDAGLEAVAVRAGLTAEQVERSLGEADKISVHDARQVLQGLGLRLAVVNDATQGKVEVTWDDDAQVWTLVAADVPGLVAEAETIELLLLKLEGLVPELAALNGIEFGVPAEALLAELRARLEAKRQELQKKHRPASA